MIDFDKKVNDYVTSNKGLYRRYCDDLIIIIPIRDDEEFNNECIEYGNKIESIVQDTPRLELSPEKQKNLYIVIVKIKSLQI